MCILVYCVLSFMMSTQVWLSTEKSVLISQAMGLERNRKMSGWRISGSQSGITIRDESFLPSHRSGARMLAMITGGIQMIHPQQPCTLRPVKGFPHCRHYAQCVTCIISASPHDCPTGPCFRNRLVTQAWREIQSIVKSSSCKTAKLRFQPCLLTQSPGERPSRMRH